MSPAIRTAAIRITALTKVYGEKRALGSADVVVEEGSVFGFLGPNGAGKTTALRILTRGEAKINQTLVDELAAYSI